MTRPWDAARIAEVRARCEAAPPVTDPFDMSALFFAAAALPEALDEIERLTKERAGALNAMDDMRREILYRFAGADWMTALTGASAEIDRIKHLAETRAGALDSVTKALAEVQRLTADLETCCRNRDMAERAGVAACDERDAALAEIERLQAEATAGLVSAHMHPRVRDKIAGLEAEIERLRVDLDAHRWAIHDSGVLDGDNVHIKGRLVQALHRKGYQFKSDRGEDPLREEIARLRAEVANIRGLMSRWMGSVVVSDGLYRDVTLATGRPLRTVDDIEILAAERDAALAEATDLRTRLDRSAQEVVRRGAVIEAVRRWLNDDTTVAGAIRAFEEYEMEPTDG